MDVNKPESTKVFQKSNKSIANQLFAYVEKKGTIFSKPKYKNFMFVGKEKNVGEIYDLWKLKFQTVYGVDAFDFKDKSVTEDMENEQIKKLQSKL